MIRFRIANIPPVCRDHSLRLRIAYTHLSPK
jgi:hypothetical protein